MIADSVDLLMDLRSSNPVSRGLYSNALINLGPKCTRLLYAANMPHRGDRRQRQHLRFTPLHPPSLVPSTFRRPEGEGGDYEGRDTTPVWEKKFPEVKEVTRNTILEDGA